jgi:primosomal protein N' (replication factor Y)
LVNILLWGRDRASVVDEATRLADQVQVAVDRVNETGDDGSDDLADSVSILGGDGWAMLGPSPCVLERLKQNWRWHILVKVPLDGDIPSVLGPVFKERKTVPGINVAVDVDALNLL